MTCILSNHARVRSQRVKGLIDQRVDYNYLSMKELWVVSGKGGVGGGLTNTALSAMLGKV